MNRYDYIELDIDRLLEEAEQKVADKKMPKEEEQQEKPSQKSDVPPNGKKPHMVTPSGKRAVDETVDKVAADKKNRRKKVWIRIGILFCLLTAAYLTIVYSNISFIAKWRTIYIETAMTTNSHQWLATLFFPQSVIDEVMARRKQDTKEQQKLNSKWDEPELNQEAKDFYDKYWEIDTEAFHKYMESHSNLAKNGYDSLVIRDLEGKEKLKTTKGDTLLVLDTKNNLMIIGVKGEGYQGKLAIIKNSDQVELGKSTALGSYGQEAGSFGETNGAVLVVNASGFKDVDGVGTGGQVKGSLVIDGVDYGHPYGSDWKFCGLKKNNRMYITNYSPDIVADYKWAVEFYPALIVDGNSVVDGTYGMGIQPRTSIGQAKNGDVLLLVVDGRQPGHSLGCTVADCEEILSRYHAYQAMNMDGGSSSVMWYNGEYITKSSSVTGIGRYMPDAIMVMPAKDEIVIEAKPEN